MVGPALAFCELRQKLRTCRQGFRNVGPFFPQGARRQPWETLGGHEHPGGQVAEGRAARWLAPCFAPRRPAVLAPGSPTAASGKKQAAKSKEELAQEKKKELERRLQDVSGQLSGSKKPAKKGSRRQAPPLRGAGSPAAALLLGRRWEGPGGRWVADPALSLWLHCVTSHVSVHEALDLLGPHFLPCTWG